MRAAFPMRRMERQVGAGWQICHNRAEYGELYVRRRLCLWRFPIDDKHGLIRVRIKCINFCTICADLIFDKLRRAISNVEPEDLWRVTKAAHQVIEITAILRDDREITPFRVISDLGVSSRVKIL